MAQGQQVELVDLKQFISDSDRGDGSGVAAGKSDRAIEIFQSNSGASIEPLWMTERRAIQQAIDACGGNINKAAGQLEVAPSTIYRKIQSWKVNGED